LQDVLGQSPEQKYLKVQASGWNNMFYSQTAGTPITFSCTMILVTVFVVAAFV
jgi:hypothetical protein